MSPIEIAPTWAEFVSGLALYRDPIVCAAAAGLVLGYIGVYVVLRRLVFVPLAVTHASAAGVALAFFLQIHVAPWISPVLGAFVCAMAATAFVMLGRNRGRGDNTVGLVYITAASLTVLLGTQISQESHEIGAIVFGTAVAVRPTDLYAMLAVGGFVLATLVWLKRGLVFASFDPDGARVQGMPVRLLDGILFACVGITIAVATRGLGALPAFAFCVLPAMGALSLVRRISHALVLAAILGSFVAVVGYILAFFWALPVGATQTAVSACFTALLAVCGRLVRR